MSEQIETITEPAPAAPRPKVKRRKPARRAAAQKVAPAKSEFPGLTSDECCLDCNIDGCVITGKPLCGHPRKGGLQPPDMANPVTLARYQRAVKALRVAEIEREQS